MNRFQVTPVNHVENIENGVYNHSYVNDEVQINLNNLSRNNPQPRTSTTSSSITTTIINHPSRKFSLAQLTSEVLPRLDNYRQSFKSFKRPSLGKLHGDHTENVDVMDLYMRNDEREAYTEVDKDAEAPDSKHTQGIKLGWIQGVLIPCLLNIWGVMLFLRLSWVVAQAGIGHSMLIISISAVVCVITTLSLSAISTNGEVKGGGIYFIISRSLGPEFGASVGIVFAFANAVAASMNTIGFCNSLNDLLKTYDVKIVDGDVNDVRIVGVVAIAGMIVICAVGMEWESKAQNFLIAIIVAAIFNFLIGTLIGPKSEEAISKGFEGFNNQLFATNWVPDYRMAEGVEQGFFSVFAIFFPSVTGIQAGANISGDLRDPASSIPKGTLLSLLISMASYASFVIFAGGAAVRDASGNTTDLINGSLIGVDLNCVNGGGCTFGLHNSYSVMQLMSVWWPLIYAGCFAATLSTALTNLLSVPRLIQALGIDRIYPGVIFFSKGYGKHGEPYRGYVLTFFISSLFLLIAELNVIAPLISNFYLASYALINFCTFHAAFIKPLGWRPTFKYYNVWLSLFGFFLCVGIMFLIDWLSSVITFVIIFALYLIVVYRKPDVNWGSSTQAQTYKTALLSAYKLQQIDDHVKNYHPQILVLSGTPLMRPPLLDLANLITKNNSLMIVGDIVSNNISYKARKEIAKEAQAWLAARKIKAFYKLIIGFDFEQGVNALIQSSGIGKLSPNLLLMGYKADWQTCNKKDLLSYFNILHKSFNNRLSVTILRLPNGLDYSHLTTEINPLFKHNGGLITANSSTSNLQQMALPMSNDISSLKPALVSQIMHADSYLNLAKIPSPNTTLTDPNAMPPMPNQKKIALDMTRNESIVYSTVGGSTVPKEVLDALNVLTKKKNINETIDVWWLYDDGGLTMLLPYIIHMRSNWSNCALRVFALTNQTMEFEVEERNMSNLLTKLRIPYSSLIMLQGVTNKPCFETIQQHSKLLDGFHEGENSECFVSDTEILTLEEKTHRQLRLRELLMEHSSNAALIVMSLPMPRQDAVSAPLYMSWLEMLTKDMPPLMLVRGNQNSVLTCYS